MHVQDAYILRVYVSLITTKYYYQRVIYIYTHTERERERERKTDRVEM